MIKRFLTYMAGLLLLAGCQDDFSLDRRPGLDEDGNLHIRFSMAPLTTVTTRAASDGLTSAEMYVYDSSELDGDYVFHSSVPVELIDGVLKGSVILPKTVTDNTNAKYVFTANVADQGNVNYKTLRSAKTSSLTGKVQSAEYYTLSSKSLTLSEVKGSAVDLYHNSVKLSVNHVKLSGTDTVKNDGKYALGAAYDFDIIGAANETYILAGGLVAEKEGNTTCSPTQPNYGAYSASTDYKFVHPTTNTGDYVNRAFVILKCQYDNKDNYYRLDFQKGKKLSSGKLTTEAFDLLANHWYQFIIKKVNGPGYLTPQEAAMNPTPMVDYDIHDHAPVIYNMISDGSRELGVSKEVAHRDKTVDSKATLYVKLYSPVTSECGELTLANKDKYISIDDSWLTVSKINGPLSGDDIVGIDSPDSNDAGSVYAVELNFGTTKDPGTISTNITITWHGLSRTVPVTWYRDFDAKELLESTAIKAFEGNSENWNNSCKWYKSDYFSFLDNETVGANLEANGDRERTDGFHFPVEYGKNDKWTYMYEVKINTALMTTGQGWKITAENMGGIDVYFSSNGSNDWQKNSISGSKTNRTFYMRCPATSYDYKSGNLLLELLDSTDDDANVFDSYSNLKLHHTGFFHQDNVRIDPSNENSYNFVKDVSTKDEKYKYYEVVKVGSDLWLDRNVGAESSNAYIKGGYGDEKAAGYYICAAKYSQPNPTIYENMCPDGFGVPSKDQWDDLRNNGNFHIKLFNAYYTPRYDDPETGKVMYLQNSRYYEGRDTEQGEKRAGYYWSRTSSSGVEKDEVGNWLKCLTLSGTASSFINGRVNGKDTNLENYMSLRAVSHRETTTPTRYSFYVEGATHVFLYTIDSNNERNQVTTWPGQAIGTWETMEEGKKFNFSFETKSSDQYYVIFNYVDNNNRIFTMSKNDFGGNVTHTNISPQVAQGWKVYGADRNNDFKESDCRVEINDSEAKEGTYWKCKPEYVPKKKAFEAGDKVIVYWKNKSNLYVWSGSTKYNGDWPGKVGSKSGDYRYCTEFSLTGNESTIGFQVNNGSDDGKKENSYSFSSLKPYWTGSRFEIFMDGEAKLVSAWTIGGTTPDPVEIPANTYRVYFKKSIGKNGLQYTINGVKSYKAKTGEDGNYYYCDFTTNTFNFALANNSSEDPYTQHEGVWWIMNSGSWERIGTGGYAFWVDAWNLSGKGLPASLK